MIKTDKFKTVNIKIIFSKEIKIFYKDDYIEIINKFRNNE